MSDFTQQGKDQEAALIASVLRRPELFDELWEMLSPNNFGWIAYAHVWQSFARVKECGLTPDVLTIGDELARRDQLETFCMHDTVQYAGRAALSKLKEVGDPANAKSYAENVLDYSAKYQMSQVFQASYIWSVNGRKSGDILTDTMRKMGEIRTPAGKASRHTQTLSEAISESYDQTDRASRGLIQFVQTGYIDIDNVLGGGLSEPDFALIAGRPGTGKTALLASIVKNICDTQPEKRVAVFSLEMSNTQIAKRLLAQESGVSYDKQKAGKLTDEDWPLFNHAIEKLGQHKNIFLNDMPAISPNRIRQELRRIGEVDFVILDYLQLAGIDGDERAENRNLEVGSISRGLKAIAKDFCIPVLAAAQLSRAVEQRASNEPQLSDLRESGSLEQDSDIVMMLYREEKDPTRSNVTHVKIAKHRNGQVGMIDLIYRANLTRFDTAAVRTVTI